LHFDGGNDNDQIQLNGGTGITATLIGGQGDDFLNGDNASLTGLTYQGGDGNDIVLASGGGDNIDGGEGDDILAGVSISGLANTMLGGGGNDFIFGTDGNDVLNGGSGNDMILGRSGADQITGGTGQDLIISGNLDGVYFDENDPPGLILLYVQWTQPDPFATRVAYLTGTPGGVLSPAQAMVAGSTVLDDGAVDTILGGDDEDYIWYNYSQDTVSDLNLSLDLRVNLA
jgi:Ca2+-binding RTX toxin-like protein